MKATWDKIDAWLQKNAPKAHASLCPGATDAALDDLDRALGFAAPAELREHLSIHDGQPPDALLGTLDGWILLGARSIGRAHGTFGDLLRRGDFNRRTAENEDGKVKAVWWSDRWIPFAVGPGGDYLVVDLDPTEEGSPGQIVTFWHADGDRDVRADSLSALLDEFAEQIEAGEYTLAKNGGIKRD